MKRFWLTFLALWLVALGASTNALAQMAVVNTPVTIFGGTAVINTTVIASNDQDNSSWRGLTLYATVSNFSAGTVTVAVQGKDPISGNYTTVLASAALGANGTTTLTVYPGITATANVAASAVLPKTWRVTLTGATSPSMTVSVAGNLQQ